jgi:hypothetical protein
MERSKAVIVALFTGVLDPAAQAAGPLMVYDATGRNAVGHFAGPLVAGVDPYCAGSAVVTTVLGRLTTLHVGHGSKLEEISVDTEPEVAGPCGTMFFTARDCTGPAYVHVSHVRIPGTRPSVAIPDASGRMKLWVAQGETYAVAYYGSTLSHDGITLRCNDWGAEEAFPGLRLDTVIDLDSLYARPYRLRAVR